MFFTVVRICNSFVVGLRNQCLSVCDCYVPSPKSTNTFWTLSSKMEHMHGICTTYAKNQPHLLINATQLAEIFAVGYQLTASLSGKHDASSVLLLLVPLPRSLLPAVCDAWLAALTHTNSVNAGLATSHHIHILSHSISHYLSLTRSTVSCNE